MSWYKIKLTEEQVRNAVVSLIQNQFTQAFLEYRGPEDAAMFGSIKGNIIYFSPSTTAFFMDVINQYLGEDSKRPERSEVALLVGHDKAWRLFDK